MPNGKNFKEVLRGWKKTGATAAIILMGVVLFVRVALIPAAEKWRALSEEVAARERELKKIYELMRRREALAAEWKSLSGPVSSGKEETTDLVRVLEKWGSSSGVSIVGLRPLRNEEPGGAARAGIQLSIEGRWPSIVDFLRKVQESPRGLSIESLHLQPSAEGESLSAALLID